LGAFRITLEILLGQPENLDSNLMVMDY